VINIASQRAIARAVAYRDIAGLTVFETQVPGMLERNLHPGPVGEAQNFQSPY